MKIIFWQMTKQCSTDQHFSLHWIWKPKNSMKTTQKTWHVHYVFQDLSKAISHLAHAQWTRLLSSQVKKSADIESFAQELDLPSSYSKEYIKCRYIGSMLPETTIQTDHWMANVILFYGYGEQIATSALLQYRNERNAYGPQIAFNNTSNIITIDGKCVCHMNIQIINKKKILSLYLLVWHMGMVHALVPIEKTRKKHLHTFS